jgi:hypothetical protein
MCRYVHVWFSLILCVCVCVCVCVLISMNVDSIVWADIEEKLEAFPDGYSDIKFTGYVYGVYMWCAHVCVRVCCMCDALMLTHTHSLSLQRSTISRPCSMDIVRILGTKK